MFLNKNLVGNTYTVEVQLYSTQTTQQINFPDVPFLRDKIITGIVGSGAPSGVTTGLPNYINSFNLGLNACFVNLQTDNGDYFMQNMPIQELLCNTGTSSNPSYSGQYTFYNTNGILMTSARRVVWPKSYLFFPTPLPVNAVMQFNIFYKF